MVVPPTDVQRYYNDNIQQYQTPEQVRASHILLETAGKNDADVKKRAEEILKQVKSGADFAALAKKVSEDKGSAANGGDLDYFGRGRMVPEFEQAAFAMQPGQISDLVKSQFGYHIIKVVDKRAGSTRPLEEVRAQIQQQLAMQTADQQVSDRGARAGEAHRRSRRPRHGGQGAGRDGAGVRPLPARGSGARARRRAASRAAKRSR